MTTRAEKEARSRRRGWLFAGLGVLLATALAGYGIWSRSSTTTQLKKSTVDSAIPQVQMVTPKNGPQQRLLVLPGNIEAWYQAAIYGQVVGYVSHWDKDYGAEVKAGDVLGTIEAPSLDADLAAARAQLVTVQARYTLAVLTAKRWTALSGTEAVAQQDVDIKNADAAELKAEVAAAQQNVVKFEAMSAFKTLAAPFDGVVTARNVNIGDYVGATGGNTTLRGSSQPLFTVADIHKLRVFVSVPQNFSDALQPGLTATMTLPQNPGNRIQLQFLTTAKAIVTATRTVVTEFVLDNAAGNLWPGTYVSVQFAFPSDPNVLIVPEQAVLFRAQGTQVALIGDGDKVHLQDVGIGLNLGTDVQVVSGLKLSDKLVANPSLGLLEGQQVKIVQPNAGADPSGSSSAAQASQPQAGQAAQLGAQPATSTAPKPAN
ncbi:MAG: efflux transporter periplasmic adaptor subunit [Rhodospirillales bacterium]|nr:efflux transporter periplasmic adaptor subunit [Rhodospirillales bacterium]